MQLTDFHFTCNQQLYFCSIYSNLHTKGRYVRMLPMAGRTTEPIKTKLGIGTHVDPRSVFVKVIYLCVTVCGIKFMPATPGEQQ